MPLSAAAHKRLSKVVAQRKPLLITGGTEKERLALAHQIHRLLPPLTKAEKSELDRIYRAAGLDPIRTRPFRAPHHTISETGLCCGKTVRMPGEVALAHSGVLFLDQVTQFRGRALTRLKNVMESGECSQDMGTARLTARLLLIAGTESGSESNGKVLQLGFAETVKL